MAVAVLYHADVVDVAAEKHIAVVAATVVDVAAEKNVAVAVVVVVVEMISAVLLSASSCAAHS